VAGQDLTGTRAPGSTELRYAFRPMTIGELVFASVVDQRVYDVQGERGSNGVYLLGVPGRALPFVLYRAWKIGTGTVTESVDFYGPSGRLVYRWGPVVRRMLGQMDLTEERDLVGERELSQRRREVGGVRPCEQLRQPLPGLVGQEPAQLLEEARGFLDFHRHYPYGTGGEGGPAGDRGSGRNTDSRLTRAWAR